MDSKHPGYMKKSIGFAKLSLIDNPSVKEIAEQVDKMKKRHLKFDELIYTSATTT